MRWNIVSPTCRLRELPRFPHALDTISGTHSASSLPYLSITSVHNFSSSSTCEQSIMNARSIWSNLEAQTIHFRLAIEMRSMAIYLKPKEENNVFVWMFKCRRVWVCPLHTCNVISSLWCILEVVQHGCLKPFFQLNQQIEPQISLTVATALQHSSKLASSYWLQINPRSLVAFWNLESLSFHLVWVTWNQILRVG